MNIAKKLSKVTQGVAIDEKGNPTDTYLEYLSLMYDSEAAEIVQHLEIFPKIISLRNLAKILNRDKQELKKILHSLAEKGFVTEAGGYAIPFPLMIYDMPFVLKVNYDGKDVVNFAKLSRKFFEEEGYYKSWETNKKGIPRTRILTVSEKIEPAHDIIPIEEVYNIINQNSSFARIPCPCRQRAEAEGRRKCKGVYPILNCIMLGFLAEGVLSLGDPVIKRLSKEEVIEIMKEASELGLVHTTDNYTGVVNIICSCCECCCGLLAGLTRPGLNNPKAIAKANYIANVNTDACVACGTCVDRCKFGAITVEDVSQINENRCMGCGLCAAGCPNDAITMKRLEREPIPENINPYFD